MPMSLGNLACFVRLIVESFWFQHGWVSAKAHGAAEFIIFYLIFLVFHNIYDGILGIFIHFRGMSAFETGDRSGILYDCQLHTVTESEVWNFILPDKFYRADNTFHTRRTKPARHNYSVIIFEFIHFAFSCLIFFGIYPHQFWFTILPISRKLDRFYD